MDRIFHTVNDAVNAALNANLTAVHWPAANAIAVTIIAPAVSSVDGSAMPFADVFPPSIAFLPPSSL